MPQFAANLSMMFQEIPNFLDRFDAAAKAGFKGVEFLFPYDFPPEAIAERLERNHLTLALFNLPPGDWAKGERGFAAIPGRQQAFMAAVETAIPYLRATKCKLIHAMAGLWPEGRDKIEALPTYIDNLRWAADRPNLQLQLDLYHVQVMRGDLAPTIRELAGKYPHIQIAGTPGRHEPDVGEINYPYLFDLLDELGYQGWIGCEYRPKGDTLAGLGWAKRYGIG